MGSEGLWKDNFPGTSPSGAEISSSCNRCVVYIIVGKVQHVLLVPFWQTDVEGDKHVSSRVRWDTIKIVVRLGYVFQ